MYNKAHFSTKLSSLRRDRSLTMSQLADQLGISDEAVRLMERGKRSPSIEVLDALGSTFNVPLDFLCGRGVFANWDEYSPQMPALLDSMAQLLEVPIERISELSLAEIVSLISVMYGRIEYDADSNSLSVHPLVSPADILKTLLPAP